MVIKHHDPQCWQRHGRDYRTIALEASSSSYNTLSQHLTDTLRCNVHYRTWPNINHIQLLGALNISNGTLNRLPLTNNVATPQGTVRHNSNYQLVDTSLLGAKKIIVKVIINQQISTHEVVKHTRSGLTKLEELKNWHQSVSVNQLATICISKHHSELYHEQEWAWTGMGERRMNGRQTKVTAQITPETQSPNPDS